MSKIFVPDSETFPRTADVVVIGGGIVGVATAFWLSRAGLDTVLLEMREGLSTLTTALSMENFRGQFTEPAMAELALPSIEMFNNLAEVVGVPNLDIAINHRGYLFATDDPSMVDDLKAVVEVHHALGARGSEFLNADEIQKRFPYISPTMVAATFNGQDGTLSSHEATQGFAKGSTARFLLKTKVLNIRTDAQGVVEVQTSRGTIGTRQVVNAAGPFARGIAGMVGIELPLDVVRRQKVYVAPKPQIPKEAPFCIDLKRMVYWRPEHGGALMAWIDPDEQSTAEPAEDVATDWDFAAIVLDKVVHLSPFWSDVAESVRTSDLHTSAGYYVYTPDDQPLIGPVADVPGFHLNCGYWAGVMLSPEAGRRTARLITGEMRPEDNVLRLSRFEEGIATESKSFLRGRH